ncbi:MAG: putative sialidase [Candidatus Saccharicenans subterraneus]|uniref:Putative sialidase n=1 Tax=Candidatus Saccharicenans subterraneus TaxID=2508984 RepID=A0A3E2BQX6_9BACT|nr:MAG: putative sialidase [Candidatus Saccharicenans subterraneum]
MTRYERFKKHLLKNKVISTGACRGILPVLSLVFFLLCLLSCSGPDENSGSGNVKGLKAGRDYVYVCREGGAGGYEAFPDVCRLKDGRLMVVFYAGYDHVSLPDENHPRGGRICYVISEDEGRTWSPARVLYDGPDDDRDPSIARLSTGRLLCTFFSLKRKDQGWEGLGSRVMSSEDGGIIWSGPRLISGDYYCSSPVRELPDGRLILGLYRQAETGSHGAVTISQDGGESWSRPIDIDNGGYPLDAETDVIPLKDGTLYAIQRSRGESMCFSLSGDGGRSWSVSEPVGFPGHSPYLLRIPGDIIVLAHRLPATSLHYSLDEARTWSQNIIIDKVIGAYPSMVELRDGSVLVVYYEEGQGSDIRARRFRLTRSGLTWLTF